MTHLIVDIAKYHDDVIRLTEWITSLVTLVYHPARWITPYGVEDYHSAKWITSERNSVNHSAKWLS